MHLFSSLAIVEPSALEVAVVQKITLSNRRTVNGLTSIRSRSKSRHIARKILIENRIRPQEIGILQNVAAAEEVDIVDSIMHTSGVVRMFNDSLQVRDDMVFEDKIEVVDSTGQSCGREAVVVSGVGESSELAWLILGIEDNSAGLLVEFQRVGDAEGGVEEVVDGDNIGVPLDDGRLNVSGRWVVDGVELALIVLAYVEQVGCSDRDERQGYGKRLHDFCGV